MKVVKNFILDDASSKMPYTLFNDAEKTFSHNIGQLKEFLNNLVQTSIQSNLGYAANAEYNRTCMICYSKNQYNNLSIT